MTDHKNPSGIFFGWWTVLVTGAISGVGVGVYTYGISALFKPIASDLGLSRALTSGAAGIGIMVGCALAPLVGMVVDRFGPKLANLFGLLTLISGLVLMNFVDSLWGLYVTWGVTMGIGVHLGLTLSMDKAVTNWFLKKIGLAMGLRFALVGTFSALTLPCVSWLVSRLGWRTACLVWAAVLLLGVPSILLSVRNNRPEHYGLLPDGEKMEPDAESFLESLKKGSVGDSSRPSVFEFNLLQAMKTRAFWILAACFWAQMLIIAGFNTHCIPLLTGMDIDPVVAGAMMGIMLIFTIPSRLMSGILADRVSKNRLYLLLILPFLFIAIGVGVFLASQTVFAIYILLILYGLAHGLPAPLFIIIISRYFGRKAFGSIFGISFLLGSPAAFLSPTLTGWLFDKTGSYNIALMSFAFISLLTIFLLFFLESPKQEDQKASAAGAF